MPTTPVLAIGQQVLLNSLPSPRIVRFVSFSFRHNSNQGASRRSHNNTFFSQIQIRRRRRRNLKFCERCDAFLYPRPRPVHHAATRIWHAPIHPTPVRPTPTRQHPQTHNQYHTTQRLSIICNTTATPRPAPYTQSNGSVFIHFPTQRRQTLIDVSSSASHCILHNITKTVRQG